MSGMHMSSQRWPQAEHLVMNIGIPACYLVVDKHGLNVLAPPSIPQVYMQWLTQLRYVSASYFALEALNVNELQGDVANCSQGVDQALVNTLTAALVNATDMQKAALANLKQPQPG